MTEQEQILDIYASISIKFGEMLDAAKSSDWDLLIGRERECRALTDTLRQTDTGGDPGSAFALRKAAFIRKALADDAEIRKFTEPWMANLEAYLGNVRQEDRLRRAYIADPGGR